MMLAVAALPNPLSHEYESPPVAITLMDVVVHVNSVTPVLLVMPAIGKAFTTTVAVAVDTHPKASVVVNVYTPLLIEDALLITGFCEAEVNDAGPLHVYATAPFAPVALPLN